MTLTTTFSNFISNTSAEIRALNFQGEPGGQGSWGGRCDGGGAGADFGALSPSVLQMASLNTEVEGQKQQLQQVGDPTPSRVQGWGGGSRMEMAGEGGSSHVVLSASPPAQSLNDKVLSLESRLEKEQKELQTGKAPAPPTWA